MKTCPVCKAQAFDDAEICYGCMYRFDDEAGNAQSSPKRVEMPPEFRIRFVPIREERGGLTWKCAVEV